MSTVAFATLLLNSTAVGAAVQGRRMTASTAEVSLRGAFDVANREKGRRRKTQRNSRAYGIALQKRGTLGADTLGLALTRPLCIYRGSATLRAATGVDADYNPIFGTERLSLAAPQPETDIEVGFSSNFLSEATGLAHIGVALLINRTLELSRGITHLP